MATRLKNLSEGKSLQISAKGFRFAVVVSEYNDKITKALQEGVKRTLLRHDVQEKNIEIVTVPGSFEITKGAQYVAKNLQVDAVICLGCIIRGGTPHFDYICESVTQGITELNLQFQIPFIFGILTTNSYKQAKDRAGGKHGNKGDEAAITAIKMVELKKKLNQSSA